MLFSNKNILFLGKVLNFTQEEITLFLEKHNSKALFSYNNEDIDLVVLSSIINPYEEELSFQLYDKGIKELKLEVFEEFYVKSLKPNALLMSLKLSNNQERLKRLLKIKSFNNETYLKLFKLYNWQNEGVFDSDDNRDITLSLIKRFYPFKDNANHNDVLHSPATLFEIALTSKNSDLLEAMTTMPEYRSNARKQEEWKPKELREYIAVNPTISATLIDSFLNLKNPRLDALLAQNPAINLKQQELILSRATPLTKQLLATNSNLEPAIFKKLLKEDTDTVKTLLINQKLNQELLQIIKETNKEYLNFIGYNEEIIEFTNYLIGKSKKLDYILASNPCLNSKQLEELYKKYGNEIATPLSQNPNTPQELLQKFYTLRDPETTKNLAANPNTPADILEELFNQDNKELNRHLALNPSLKDEHLDYFKLDNELLRIMAQNPKFLKKVSMKEYI